VSGRERLKAEQDLEWLFAYAAADLGISSGFGSFMNHMEKGPSSKGYTDGESQHDQAIGRIGAVERFQYLSSIVNRLPVPTQRVLMGAFSFRRWLPDLARRPIRFRAAALECQLVRDYLGGKWTAAAAERLLVSCEVLGSKDPELKKLRVRVWSEAERTVDKAVTAYMAASTQAEREKRDEKAERVEAIRRGG
jgi:hypothetical protein